MKGLLYVAKLMHGENMNIGGYVSDSKKYNLWFGSKKSLGVDNLDALVQKAINEAPRKLKVEQFSNFFKHMMLVNGLKYLGQGRSCDRLDGKSVIYANHDTNMFDYVDGVNRRIGKEKQEKGDMILTYNPIRVTTTSRRFGYASEVMTPMEMLESALRDAGKLLREGAVLAAQQTYDTVFVNPNGYRLAEKPVISHVLSVLAKGLELAERTDSQRA